MNTKEIAAEVRASLKQELPGWKFSVTFDSFSGGSSIDLCLMSGPEEVLDPKHQGHASLNHFPFIQPDHWHDWRDKLFNNGYQMTEVGWLVMEKAAQILARRHWDKSDIQSDYFCCNFYMHVAIGKWDKGYQVKP